MVNITQTQPISVVFGVPETNLPQINTQLKAAQPLQVEAWDREQKVKLATGKVRNTDNAIDLPTGTIKVKADFANADNTLFPNQFVNIRLQLAELKDALVVPMSAIQRGAQGIFVYVVKADNTVTVRRVRLGITEGDLVSIQGDVAASEQVVTDGADRLREGAKIDVIAPTTTDRGSDRGATAGVPSSRSSQAASGADAAKERREPRIAPTVSAPNSEVRAAPSPGGGADRPRERGAEPGGEGNGERRNGPGAEGGERGARMLERLPPDVAEKVKAMSPDERRAFFQKMREQRRQEGQ
jgi:multidrug efflux system membrane fusion protein